MTGIRLVGRNPELEARAAALYSDALPYHNFLHVRDTLRAAEIILGRCRAENIRADSDVVYYALLFHDARYHDDHVARGYRSKEAYSAALAAEALGDIGVAPAKIRKCTAAILATERDGTFVSAEQKAVRAADLSGMAAEYPEFLQHSLKLKREYELLHGAQLSWIDWQRISAEVLRHYLSQEIRLTSYFHNEWGESTFHARVRSNLERLMQEPLASA
jgi:predicted metal-dependent HD superfamily phosphohydrolase